ncbi:MAG: hypothetical protein A2070_09625 [Bdellovibrionales bacterium GWC1_52_8]|nr:MAG: hypothetical protein A2Z97_12915 [Bdellovibrionales bacterium GWB1_52_6]OFZ05735.1 MAG: hypothetical protein A2X97_03470 [Bdellovibrionales bacterium GWA1_52_35]OFZ35571.1 MAG: hypothetical protein A2070_09625 [Bdellovibrionales bacterium GWC1_52_8]
MGLQGWFNLATAYNVDCGQPKTGNFLREFRNKAFREPAWTKASTPEGRIEVREEYLWAPERRIAGVFEARFEVTLPEIEDKVRAELLDGSRACLTRIDDLPILAVSLKDGRVDSVTLGNGQILECSYLVYADRWAAIRTIQGLPVTLQQAISTSRKREPMSVIQASLTHSAPLALGVSEGFYSLMNKEAGEDTDRHVWGYFSSDGLKSFWTLCLSRDEVENNHEIAKKLRRMKAALDKMFAGTSWLPEGKTDFMSTVLSEHVRFEECFLFSESTFDEVKKEVEPLVAQLQNAAFMTDAFGPAIALHQVALQLESARAPLPELRAGGANSEAENMDTSGAGPVES